MRAGWSNPSKPPNPPSGPHHLLLGSPGRRWGTLGGMDTNTRPLTARQREVLDLWLAGTPYKELAARLGISPETVNPHLKGIAKKLDAGGISREALRRAVYAPRR